MSKHKLPITDQECDEALLNNIRFYLKKGMPEPMACELLENNIKEKSNLEKLWNSLVSKQSANHHSGNIA